MSAHVQSGFVAPNALGAAPGWSPSYFCGASAVALQAGLAGGRTITELGGQVLEGWRVSETPNTHDYDPRAASTPVYRQANITPLRLRLGAEHWTAPEIDGRWCVRPGDVVLSKFAPLHAALVSAAAKRHPVDGNTIIVRNLPRVVAAWLALCLEHPGYERLVLQGYAVFQRVGLKGLAALRVPPPPPTMEGLAARLFDALDEQVLTREAMHHLRIEASEATGVTSAKPRSMGSGAFYAGDAMSHDSWLPGATGLRAEQRTLSDAHGWISVGELASWDDRARLTGAPDNARALRLGDVGEDLFVTPSADAKEPAIASRTLAKPLIPGEVLLSTIGTSFRTAYVDDDVPMATFPTDGWVRLRFRETPAAWALLLSTDALRSQAARLAVGSVQQFVPPEALRTLRVPMLPPELRERWQRAVERHHAQRRTQDRQWAALINEMTAVFEAAHRPFASTLGREKEPVP